MAGLLPHRPLLVALACWFGVAVLVVVRPGLLPVWGWGGAVLLGVALADAGLALRRGNPLTARREVRAVWPLGVAQTIGLRLAGGDGAGWVFDRPPVAFAAAARPVAFRVRGGEWTQVHYRLTPTERGEHRFDTVELRLLSPWRLWLTRHRTGETQTVRVYPDFARIAEYSLLATDNRLSQLGVLRRRRRGEGSDFQQLREYRRDDALRSIDWKATAKHRKPIVREYQDERDQRLMFLLDCGQRMRARDDALSHFDHTLNALLLLAYVALRQGDGVGLATFAHAQPRFLAPRKSLDTVQHLLDATYDLQPTPRTPDYLMAAQSLAGRLERRALIVLLTNLRDEDESSLVLALRLLGRRHGVLVANLRETALDAALARPIADFDAALGYAAAVDYRRARRRQWAMLKAQGAQVLEVAPPGLPTALVNRYWEMKRGGLL